MGCACLLGAGLAAPGPSATPPRAEDPPNIVLFLVDDLGWQDTSVPLAGEPTPLNARYRTPNAERLAERGVRFTSAYASAPVCTPTRTSILTGQCPGRSRITFWTLNANRDHSAGRHPMVDPPEWGVNGLGPDDVTLPKLLQAAGYRTIHAGKAHFGARGTGGADPTNLGFDVNIAGHAAGSPGSYWGSHGFSRAGRQGERRAEAGPWDVPDLEAWHGQDVYLTEALAQEAVAAVREAVGEGEPFFLHFAPYAVHAPIMANRKLLEGYPELDEIEAAYATMVETVDRALGSVVEALDQLGVGEDTVILFSSDNGGLSAHSRGRAPDGSARHAHNAPLASGKGSAYEGGTRVPTIIAGPGVRGGGRACSTPIISHDFFPTVLAMAGVELPEELAPRVDGRDLGPLLRSEPGFDAGRALCWNQPHQWGAPGPGIFPFTSIRRGDWKLIYSHADRRFELYHLGRDLGESSELAREHPEVVLELAGELDRWISEAGVQLSIDRASGRPIPTPGAVARARQSAGELHLRVAPLPASSRGSIDDLRPRAHVLADPDWYVWGGSMIEGDEGGFHLFHSRWRRDNPRGMKGWLYESEIARAVAERPEGPYRPAGVVLAGLGGEGWGSVTAHNPCIRRFEGRYHLYFVSTWDSDHMDTDWRDHQFSQRVGVAVADELGGPWRRVEQPVCQPAGCIHHYTTNPSVTRMPDGRYLMMLKGLDQEGGWPPVHGVALADSPTGPFAVQDEPCLPPGLHAEDPDVRYDRHRGRFLAVFKDWRGQHTGTQGGIGLIESDDGLRWRKGAHPLVCLRELVWDDGSTTPLAHLERPQLHLDADGRPDMLFCAAARTSPFAENGGLTFNVHLRIAEPGAQR